MNDESETLRYLRIHHLVGGEQLDLAADFLSEKIIRFAPEEPREVESFQFDSAHRTTLDAVAEYLRTHRQARFLVEGHANPGAPEQAKQELSERRAEAVTNYLVSRGISRVRLDAVGRGTMRLRNPDERQRGDAPEFLGDKFVRFAPMKPGPEDVDSFRFESPESTDTLDAVVEYLRNHPEVRIRVEGYAEKASDDEREIHRELSERRAQAVSKYLASQGIALDRLETRGRGWETSPGEEQFRNARVLFSVSPGVGSITNDAVVFDVSPKMGRRPSVAVFGAGVAGLTAAHELVERGFDVFVVEKDSGMNAQRIDEMRIGGMAMSQYVEGEKFAEADAAWEGRTLLPGEHGFRFFPSYYHHLWDTLQRIPLYEKESASLEAGLTELERKRLRKLAGGVNGKDPRKVHSFSAAVLAWLENESEVEKSGLDAKQVKELTEIAEDQNRTREDLEKLATAVEDAVGISHRTDLERTARLFFRDAGEDHQELGARIVLEESRDDPDAPKLTPTNRTVYDNVVPCSTLSIIARDRTPFFFAREPTRSAAVMMDQAQGILASGFEVSDLNTYAYRLLRYMCTSDARRADECEDISVTDYLEGRDNATAPPRYHYSEEFLKQIEFSPRVLAALDAEYGDARTNLSTMVQILSNNFVKQPKVDGVMNGPTTKAWFEPWKLHLEQLGVRFISAKLNGLEWKAGEVSADVVRRNTSDYLDEKVWIPLAERADYFVVAMDAPSAEKVTKLLREPRKPGAPAKVGVPGQLEGYASVPIDDPTHRVTWPAEKTRKTAFAGSQRAPWDRFQTLTGIQYFFKHEFSMVHGHVYFPKAEWGLSAICQEDFWIDRPTRRKNGYTSVLSVDIGAWNKKSTETGKTAAESTREEIAKEVWDQMSRAIRAVETGLPLLEPTWYHLDENIEFDLASGPVSRNKAPYFIPIMGDFKNRPGGAPWNPATGRANPTEDLDEGVWRAEHGGYWVHWDKLVFAGTYKKTFTRLTTMEAACESGRHAVNAIMDHYLHERAAELHDPDDPESPTDPSGGLAPPWNPTSGFTTATFRSPVFAPTALGNYCQIWNIEENELPDLEIAKRADEWCFEHGLPHPWEMLGWDNLSAFSSSLGSFTSGSGSALGRLAQLFRASALQTGLLSPLLYARNLGGWLEKIRRAIEELGVRPPTSGKPPPNTSA